MANVVNPHGWRLAKTKYWNSIYYLKDEGGYPLTVHQFNSLYSIVRSILLFVSLVKFHEQFLTFSSLRILAAKRELIFLIKLKIYWKNLFNSMQVLLGRHTQYLSLQKTTIPYLLEKISSAKPGKKDYIKRQFTKPPHKKQYQRSFRGRFKKRSWFSNIKKRHSSLKRKKVVKKASADFEKTLWRKYSKRSFWDLHKKRRISNYGIFYTLYNSQKKQLLRNKNYPWFWGTFKRFKKMYPITYRHPVKKLTSSYYIFKVRRRRGVRMVSNYFDLIKNKPTAKFTRSYILFFLVNPLLHYIKEYIAAVVNFKFQTDVICRTYFIGLNSKVFNMVDFMTYIKYLLSVKRYSPMRVLYHALRVLNTLKINQGWRGYKFLLAGRFSRRGARAAYIWRSSSNINTGNKAAILDYFVQPVQLRYSKSIIKLWVAYNEREEERKKL